MGGERGRGEQMSARCRVKGIERLSRTGRSVYIFLHDTKFGALLFVTNWGLEPAKLILHAGETAVGMHVFLCCR